MASLLVMLLLALPFLSLRLGFSDQGNDPPTTTTRQAYDALARGFGPGFNGPLQIVARIAARATRPRCSGSAQAVGGRPGRGGGDAADVITGRTGEASASWSPTRSRRRRTRRPPT